MAKNGLLWLSLALAFGLRLAAGAGTVGRAGGGRPEGNQSKGRP